MKKYAKTTDHLATEARIPHAQRLDSTRTRTVILPALTIVVGLMISSSAQAADPAFVTISNNQTSTCLDSGGPANWVYLWSCYLGFNQYWWVADTRPSHNEAFGTFPTTIKRINQSGQVAECLDAWPMSNYAGGYRVSYQPCNGGYQQDWELVFVAGNCAGGMSQVGDYCEYELQSRIANDQQGVEKCLSAIYGQPNQNGEYVGIATCNSGDQRQLWGLYRFL